MPVVSKVLVRNAGPPASCWKTVTSCLREFSVSSLDPRRTFLQLLESNELPAEFVADIKRFKFAVRRAR